MMGAGIGSRRFQLARVCRWSYRVLRVVVDWSMVETGITSWRLRLAHAWNWLRILSRAFVDPWWTFVIVVNPSWSAHIPRVYGRARHDIGIILRQVHMVSCCRKWYSILHPRWRGEYRVWSTGHGVLVVCCLRQEKIDGSKYLSLYVDEIPTRRERQRLVRGKPKRWKGQHESDSTHLNTSNPRTSKITDSKFERGARSDFRFQKLTRFTHARLSSDCRIKIASCPPTKIMLPSQMTRISLAVFSEC